MARIFSTVLLSTCCACSLSAQSRPEVDSTHVSIFRAHDAVVAGGVVAVAAATMSVDESIARSLQRPSVRSNTFLKGATNVFSNLGFPGSAMLSAVTYFLGLCLLYTSDAAD